MGAAGAAYGIVFGALLLVSGLYAYFGRSAPRYFSSAIWSYLVHMFIPSGLGFVCICAGLLLVPSAAGGALVFCGLGLNGVAIVVAVFHPRAIRPWWLKDGSSWLGGGNDRERTQGSVLDLPADAPVRPARAAVYEERRRLTVAHLVVVLTAAGFTFLGVLGGLAGMPPGIAAVIVLVFGGGGGVAALFVLMSWRRIALRIDGEGVTLGSPWPARVRRCPWPRVRSIWLWSISYPLHRDYVGVDMSGGAATVAVRNTRTMVPRGVVGLSIPIDDWRFDVTSMLQAVECFAAHVPVFRARPGESPELVAGRVS